MFTYPPDFYLKWPFVPCNGCIVDNGKFSVPFDCCGVTCTLAKYGNYAVSVITRRENRDIGKNHRAKLLNFMAPWRNGQSVKYQAQLQPHGYQMEIRNCSQNTLSL